MDGQRRVDADGGVPGVPEPLTGGERLRGGAVAALWGWAAASLAAWHCPEAGLLATAAAVACAAGGFIRPRSPVLGHPFAAAAAVGAGLLMSSRPEPAFFLLVPLLAAGVAWSLAGRQNESDVLPAWALPATAAFGAAVFFVQSANRHWGFASGSRDLGLFYQSHWLMAHGLSPQNTVMGLHAFADHVAALDALVAQLLRVHDGPETLLFAQACAAASGAVPLYWLARSVLGRARWALAVAWAWLLAPDLHSAVMFDYNPTTLGSAGLLWTAWALVCRGPTAAVVLALITCLAKENLCPYVAVLSIVLAWRGAPRRRCLAVGALAIGVFLIDMWLLLGSTFDSRGYPHWRFEDLGESPAEAVGAAVRRPDQAATLLVNHPQKRRSLLLPLMASGYVGLADPLVLVLQLPNWGERFLSTHRTRWWGYYYGMPAAATAVIGLVFGWKRLAQAGRARHLAWYVVACAAVAGLAPPYRTPGGNFGSDLYRLRQPYASGAEDVRTQRHAVAFVGRDPAVKVAAQYHLLPHLAGRPFIVMLDRAAEADTIALQLNGGTYPEGRPAWRRRLRGLRASGAFQVAFCEGQSVVLRRGAGRGVDCPAWEALVGPHGRGTAPHPSAGN